MQIVITSSASFWRQVLTTPVRRKWMRDTKT